MPGFITINNSNKLTISNLWNPSNDSDQWVPSAKFNSKDRLVDANGKAVSSHYLGSQYRIVEKKEYVFSTRERLQRGYLGTIAVVFTLGLALLSKPVRNLFTKPKTNIRFAIPEEPAKFIKPKLIFNEVEIPGYRELNFALIKTKGGKEKLVAVARSLLSQEYQTYEGSALEALLTIAQNKQPHYCFSLDRHYGSPIGYFLKHPNNTTITEEKFLKFILAKDESGTPRICTLNAESTLEVLNIIKEKKIPINLNEKTSAGETLFTIWAGQGHANITKLLIDLKPSVIEQTKSRINSAFVVAVLNRSKEEANILLNAMEKRNIILTPQEEWIKRAFTNDCEFSEDAFAQLDQELKAKIFFVANAFANEELVKKLKRLGMDEAPLFLPGPNIFAENMDIITTRNVMTSFLKGLRKDGLLLTSEEFGQLDESKYIQKRDQIGRIQGRNFIERLVKENGLKHIKVPKKIAVINDGLQSISFRAARTLELAPKENQIKIYAECIEPIKRNLTLEEAIEFMIILEKSGYGDFFGGNFFFAKDGIYFIDTEFKEFDPTEPNFDAIKTIVDQMDPKDADKFLAEYEKRKKAYAKEAKLHQAEKNKYRSAFANPHKRLVTGFTKHEFAFPLDLLCESIFELKMEDYEEELVENPPLVTL